ncbi:MAG: DUF937 domain-containing protein [Oscillospiraceae bacterium]|nr:DUF937 domain-containing protein [Oscillospiraceae bacterium]
MAGSKSILDTLLSGSSVGALSELTGAGGDQVQQVLSQALPTLIGGMKNNASSKDGEESLASALSAHAKDDTSDIASFLKNADLSDGDKILSHILGGQKPSVESGIAKKAGVSKDQTATILSAAAPLLLSLLGSKKEEDEKESNSGGLGGLLGSLLGGGSGNDGFGLDDVASMLLGGGNEDKEEKEESGGGLGDMLMGGLGSLLGFGGSDEKEKKPAAKKPSTKKKTTAKKTSAKTTSKKPTAVKKPSTTAAKRPTIRRKIP